MHTHIYVHKTGPTIKFLTIEYPCCIISCVITSLHVYVHAGLCTILTVSAESLQAFLITSDPRYAIPQHTLFCTSADMTSKVHCRVKVLTAGRRPLYVHRPPILASTRIHSAHNSIDRDSRVNNILPLARSVISGSARKA